jgi:crotonobetainyl-CoA:carnitine CoA-transferase CaiB-like acyl-CoA transferase
MTLRGARVLDLSTEIAGPYCTKLLADAGADVVKVEPREGDPLRTWTSAGPGTAVGTGVLFDFLNTSKRSILKSDGDLDALAAAADIVVVDGPLPFPRLPHQVVVSLSPFGLAGPWADRPATEFTLQAWCGSTGNRGLPQRDPVYAGGRLGEWIGGAYAAAAAASFHHGARVTGAGTHLDVSLFECMCLTMNTYATIFASFLNWREPPPGPVRTIETPSIEPTEDGYVGFCTITAQQFQDFLVLIERPDLLADTDLATAAGRSRRLDEVLGIIRPWTSARQTEDIIKRASELRIPIAPIGNGAAVTGFDHFTVRGVFVPSPGADHLQPRIPYRIHGTAEPGFRAAPALGADSGHVNWSRRAAPVPEGPPAGGRVPLPLAGLRVIDFTAFWAGPAATHFLAAMGADVIKIESIQRPDGMRFTSTAPPKVDRWWEWCPVFHGANGGKRSVTLDLSRPAGLDLVKRLIAGADAVTENFSPRVMENFGLGWEVVHEVNPAAVMVRMPAFGLDGPWRDRTGFAQNMEQVSGLAWVTGYQDGAPIIPRGACDPLAGMHVVVALLAALDERERSGEGSLVESTAVEVALNVAAEQVLEYGAYHRLIGRNGNRGPVAAPQGVYASQTAEEWIALATETDAQWQALAGVLDATGVLADGNLTGRADLAAAAGRHAAHDELDRVITQWCAARPQSEAVAALLDAGVPAAPAINPKDIAFNPQLGARAFFEPIDHPVTGHHDLPGFPFRAAGHDKGWLRSPPPTLGEHNEEVLGGLLGLDAETLAALAAEGVIGTRPIGL